MVVKVVYQNEKDARFDKLYYLSTHLELLKRLWGPFGLQRIVVMEGAEVKSDAERVDRMVAHLTFSSSEDFVKAAKAHGREIMEDVSRFTNIKPITQNFAALWSKCTKGLDGPEWARSAGDQALGAQWAWINSFFKEAQ